MRSVIVSAALIGAALLAGCASTQLSSVLRGPVSADTLREGPSAQRTPVPQYPVGLQHPGWSSPQWSNSLRLYIADQGKNQIDIFPEVGKVKPQIGAITIGIDGPYGLYVDKQKALYVANQSNSTVTKYANDATSPELTYSQDLSRPLYPIVDKNGDLFVGNANNGTVVEYLPGETSAFKVIQTAGSEVDGMDFDKHGNLFVAYRNGGPGSIEEFAPGSSTGTILGMTLDQPQGVVVDCSGNILAAETGGTSRIDFFPPGSTTPTMTLPLPNSNTPTQVTMTQSMAFVYVSSVFSGNVFGIDYPLPGQSFFLKDQTQPVIQGATVTDDQIF
jgi:hypothetical protein